MKTRYMVVLVLVSVFAILFVPPNVAAFTCNTLEIKDVQCHVMGMTFFGMQFETNIYEWYGWVDDYPCGGVLAHPDRGYNCMGIEDYWGLPPEFSTNAERERYKPSKIPSAEEFLEMTCNDLEHIFQEFPDKKTADAWNTRMHECAKEPLHVASVVSTTGIEEILEEMQNLRQMSCNEIIQRNTEGKYLSSDNRKLARDKVLDCSDMEESFAANASCQELHERYHGGQDYWFEDHKQMTENRLAKCPNIMENEY